MLDLVHTFNILAQLPTPLDLSLLLPLLATSTGRLWESSWTLDNYTLFMFLAEIVKVLFVMAFGACIGSLTNVLVYRLPLGLDVVRPQSRCPSCGTLLTWRENVPIFGWLFLGGRCRFCKNKISAEYPLVEAFVAVMFAAVYLTLYSDTGTFLGIPFEAIQPEWAVNGFRQTWPTFIVTIILFSCLVAMTLVDAKTFTIPMVLTTVPVVVAVLFHPLHALWVEFRVPGGRLWIVEQGWSWTFATPGPNGWWWVGGSIGAVAGLILSNILVLSKATKPSFSDYPEWEAAYLAQAQAAAAANSKIASESGILTSETLSTASLSDIPADIPADIRSEIPADIWVQYPHARREMIRELMFLAPAIGLGLLGAAIAFNLAGPWVFDPAAMEALPTAVVPLWLDVLAGVLMGYVIGGGVVWLVRIAGSLAFGKEAMGLGDVHMMAAVGACIGWTDATLGFFGAAFVGVAYAAIAAIGGTRLRSLPYGPHLAVATVVVWFAKPLVERGLGLIMQGSGSIHLP